jgi:hypothetical protein
MDTLKRFSGFFIIQSNMTFNMPQIFEQEQLRALWDTAMLTLKKSFELAM